jgi:hypothetical protein
MLGHSGAATCGHLRIVPLTWSNLASLWKLAARKVGVAVEAHPVEPGGALKARLVEPGIAQEAHPRRSAWRRTLRPFLVGAAASTSASSSSVTSTPNRRPKGPPSRSHPSATARPSLSVWAKHGWSGSSCAPIQPGVPVGAAWHSGQSDHQGNTRSAGTAATRKLQQEFEARDVEFKCLVFLRSDIYEQLQRGTPDKGKGSPRYKFESYRGVAVGSPCGGRFDDRGGPGGDVR